MVSTTQLALFAADDDGVWAGRPLLRMDRWVVTEMAGISDRLGQVAGSVLILLGLRLAWPDQR